MNLEETARILAKIALIENRKFTDEQIGMWQSILREIELKHAEEALLRYYQGQTESIKPAHIYRLAKEVKAETRKRHYGISDS